eukprot:COSAG06_NODE_8933_length_2029_cov_1.679793_1_plen_468_part_00
MHPNFKGRAYLRTAWPWRPASLQRPIGPGAGRRTAQHQSAAAARAGMRGVANPARDPARSAADDRLGSRLSPARDCRGARAAPQQLLLPLLLSVAGVPISGQHMASPASTGGFSLSRARDVAAEMRASLQTGDRNRVAPGSYWQTYTAEFNGCSELRQLAQSAPTTMQRRAILSQEVGAGAALVDAMQAFSGEPALQNNCCLTLTTLAGAPDEPDTDEVSIQRITEAGGMLAAREAVNNFPQDQCTSRDCGVPYCSVALQVLDPQLDPCAKITGSISRLICENKDSHIAVIAGFLMSPLGFIAAVLACILGCCSHIACARARRVRVLQTEVTSFDEDARAAPGPTLGELLPRTMCVAKWPRGYDINMSTGDTGCSTPRLSSTLSNPLYECSLASSSQGGQRGHDSSGGGGRVSVNESCVVCLEAFVGGESLIVLSGCSHRFHADCISEWLESQSSCPICRAVVVPPH